VAILINAFPPHSCLCVLCTLGTAGLTGRTSCCACAACIRLAPVLLPVSCRRWAAPVCHTSRRTHRHSHPWVSPQAGLLACGTSHACATLPPHPHCSFEPPPNVGVGSGGRARPGVAHTCTHCLGMWCARHMPCLRDATACAAISCLVLCVAPCCRGPTVVAGRGPPERGASLPGLRSHLFVSVPH
jgi:hypothetical protein